MDLVKLSCPGRVSAKANVIGLENLKNLKTSPKGSIIIALPIKIKRREWRPCL